MPKSEELNEKRKSPRFLVDFRSSFSSVNRIQGEGVLVNLSIKGGRIESRTEVKPGAELELQIQLNDRGDTLTIAKAAVRWLRGQAFGLEFLDMEDAEWKRLCAVMRELEQMGPVPPAR